MERIYFGLMGEQGQRSPTGGAQRKSLLVDPQREETLGVSPAPPSSDHDGERDARSNREIRP